MNAKPGRWRRMAVTVARHASRVLPRARSPWAEAMRRELDYIEDDRAALHWAIGCVMASYGARLAALPRLYGRILSRPVLAGSMLLSVALALGHAATLTDAPAAAVKERGCDLPAMPPDIHSRLDCGTVLRCQTTIAADFTDDRRPTPDQSCADQNQPRRFIATPGRGR